MRYLLIISLALLAACSSTRLIDSETLYPYKIDTQAHDHKKLKRLIIANVNYIQNSPSYLQQYETAVDSTVAEHLREQGYEVLTGNQFDSVWAAASDKYGGYYNQSNATYRRDRFNKILSDTLETLKKKYQVDAVVFTDLLVRRVNFSGNNRHYAAWDGVKRKPRIKGTNGIPSDFNWAKSFRASSLSVIIFRYDKEFIFHSVGGIEMIDNLNVISGTTPKATRHNDLFSDKSALNEGIALALHPFIPMTDYPETEILSP